MAEQTLAFTEVKHFNTRELNQLKKKTYAEIYWKTDTNFCVTVKKASRLADIFEEIIPCCQRMTTADGDTPISETVQDILKIYPGEI